VQVSATGSLGVAGLEWLGARAYDPSTRAFLSTDPLAPALGAGWDGNPYAYAGNNPLAFSDPNGLKPLTDEELKAYDDSARNVFQKVGDWVGDNWEYIVAGAAIVVGVGLMFTGVGGPAGIALMAASGAMLSGGISVATQKATTGEVNWGKVGVDAAVGALAGGAGAGTGAFLAGKMGTSLAARAATGAASGAAEGGVSSGAGYLLGPGPHTPEGFAATTLTGAATGGAAGGITAYKPKWLDADTASTFKFGIYRSGYTHGETTLYRAGGIGPRADFGGYWSHDAPLSVAQVRQDKAILPVWFKDGKPTGFSPLNNGYAAEFAPGTPVYSGTVAPQVDYKGNVYTGGTQQVHIPESWTHGTIVDKWKLLP
jgi:RHS repeat-associated protein